MPVLLLAHGVTIGFSVYTGTAGRSLRDYITLQPPNINHPTVYWYQRSFRSTFVLFVLGLFFLLTNLFTEGLFDDGGCTDPFIRLSIAPIEVSSVYQWLFVLYAASVLWVLGVMAEILQRNDPKHKAKSVYRYICSLACDPEVIAAQQALQQWKSNCLGSSSSTQAIANTEPPDAYVPGWRKALFYIFHLPILVLGKYCSSKSTLTCVILGSVAPSNRVCAQSECPEGYQTLNTLFIVIVGDSGGGWYYTILGNSVIIAAINIGDLSCRDLQ